MTLLEQLHTAAAALKAAARLAADWRVREAVAGAGTALHCAIHLQKKIEAGSLDLEHQPMKAPSTKHQAPEKLQAPNPKRAFDGSVWVLGAWCFSGAWCLVLGASAARL